MPRRRPKAGFVFMDVAAKILKNPAITREALRVLGVLLEHVDWRNRMRIKVREIGEALDIAAPHASRGLAVLREHGVVTLIQQGEYELHPELLHVGTLASAKRRQKRRAEQESRQPWVREEDVGVST